MTIPPIKTALVLKLRETSTVIAKRIKKALSHEINHTMKMAAPILKGKVKLAAAGWIADSPEMQDLVSGTMRGHFGVPDAASQVGNIITAIAGSVDVHWEPVGASSAGTPLKVAVQPGTFVNVLGVVPPQETEKGELLPWIEWLLLRGDSPIIVGYEVEEGPFGRTGEAHMVKTGGEWSVGRVDPSFSGTIDDNFITRALSERASALTIMIKDSIQSVL